MLKVPTIKILMESDFSSNLTLLLPTLGGGLSPLLGTQPNIVWGGGVGPSQRDIKLRPCR